MTYQQALNYLESFINYEKLTEYPYKQSLKLERIKDFLSLIGNPEGSLRYIHVAGTKGKGSTCAFISYILRQAGFKVGLYTSPHLSDFRERIRILRPCLAPHNLKDYMGQSCKNSRKNFYRAGRRASSFVPRHSSRNVFEGMISRQELARLVDSLKPAIEKYNQVSKYGPLSFFEIYTSLSFVYFKDQKIDFAVLETGLGGRLDATNVIEPLVCAITPISYEHTQKLGNTLREIATEKAGIIRTRPSSLAPRPSLIVISAPQEKEALKVIKARCKKQEARLYLMGRDILIKRQGNSFNVKGLNAEYKNLKIKLIGDHQVANAAVAIGVVESLERYNINISRQAIAKGLAQTLWPGRCEIILKRPLLVLDGAQNVASSLAVKETIKEKFKFKRLILVLGTSKDKDIPGVCRKLEPLADKIILTKANNPRACSPNDLAQHFDNRKTFTTGNVKAALNLAIKEARREDLILVTGSLFVVGEAREAILKKF